MLMVVAPLEQELAGLRRALRSRTLTMEPADGIVQPMALHAVGLGRQAGERVQSLLSARRDRLEGLLLLGFAGAMAPTLATGDVVLAQRYYQGSSQVFIEADSGLCRRAAAAASETGLPIRELDSLTLDHLVSTPQEKQALVQRYPAGTVNMEDYWVASAARDAGVPFLAVRSVLDKSTQRLPSYLLELPPSRAGAALTLASRPWRVLPALVLARQSAVASAALARFALAFSRERSKVEHGPTLGSLRR